MPALKYWNGAAWATISNVAGPAGPQGPAGLGGYSLSEEFKPSGGATTVTVSQVPQFILVVSRDGMVQSAADSHYSLTGSTLTFTDAFNGTERVIVEYAIQGAAPIAPFNGAGLTAGSVGTTQLTDGSVTSAKILDGTIATADLADRSVTNIKLGTDTARANLLTNGGFEIWQRGTAGLTSAFTADRWQTAWGAGGAMTVNRDSANADGVAGFCAAYSYTHGSAQTNVYQTVENVLELRGKAVTLGIRVRCAVASGVRARIWNGSAEVLSGFHTGDGTYQTLTVTTTIPAGSNALYVGIALFVSGTYYLDNAMLVVGSVAADYSPLHPADDLARCQRYYELIGGDQVGEIYFAGHAAVANQAVAQSFGYKASKAVGAPTVTKVGTWTVANAGQPTLFGTQGKSGFSMYVAAIGVGAVAAHNSAAGCYVISESNP